MALTYASYLHLDDLLKLQQPRSEPAEHDEMVFIVVHQAYELWFRLQLHELEKVRADLRANRLWDAVATFKRARTVLKVMVEQMDVLDTLTPMSFYDAFYDFLEHNGVTIPPEVRQLGRTEPAASNEAVEAGVLRLYRSRPDMVVCFELMTDFDEGLQEWRYRHIKLVERTIGSKRGTGGSLGVAFLKESLFRPIFPDLWAMRHQL
jgi:tryptophan 2,3-dioxygenase